MKSWSNKETGSPSENSEFIVLAEIAKEWGVKGKMKALPLSKKFSMLKPGDAVHLLLVEGLPVCFHLETINHFGTYAILSFAGITSRNDAIPLRASLISIEKNNVPLEQGEYFYDQIIGLSVMDQGGRVLGVVDDILETGSNDVYVIKNGSREYLVPAIKDVIERVDILHKYIIIKPFHGIFD